MPESTFPTPNRRPLLSSVTLGEFIFAAALLALILGAEIWLTGSSGILFRPFWLDELMSFRLASDPNFIHAMTALQNGVDGDPPTRYMLLRWFCALTGGANELTLRLFSLLGGWAVMVGAYLIARYRAGIAPALVAALVVGAHPVLVEEQFQARFYATQVAAVVWFYLILLWSRNSGRFNLLAKIGLAITSVLVCTLHYFGIFSWGLIVGAELLLDRRPLPARARSLWPTLAGPAALLASMPFYFHQRASLSMATWIAPADLEQTLAFFRDLLATLPMALLLIAYFAIYPKRNPDTADSTAPNLQSMAALLLLPIVIWLFSLLIQPALLTKYAINTVGGFVPIAAFLVTPFRRSVTAIVAAIMIAIGSAGVISQYRYNDAFAQSLQGLINSLQTRGTTGEPIVYAHSDEFCEVVQYAGELADRSFFLDFDTPPAGSVSAPPPMMICERDTQRAASKYYPMYKMTTPAALSSASKFLLVAQPPDVPILERLLPGFKFYVVDQGVLEARRN